MIGNLGREYLRNVAASHAAYVAVDETNGRPAVVVPLSETFGLSRFQVYRALLSLQRAGLEIARVRSKRTILIIYLDNAIADVLFPHHVARTLRARASVTPYTVSDYLGWLIDGVPLGGDGPGPAVANVENFNDVRSGSDSTETGRGDLPWWAREGVSCPRHGGVTGEFWRAVASGRPLDRPILGVICVFKAKNKKTNYRASFCYSKNWLKSSEDNLVREFGSLVTVTDTVGVPFRRWVKAKQQNAIGSRDPGNVTAGPGAGIVSAVVDAVADARETARADVRDDRGDRYGYTRHPFVRVWAEAFRMKPWHLRQPWRRALAAMPTDPNVVQRWANAITHLRAVHGLRDPWRVGLMLEVFAGRCPVCVAIRRRKEAEAGAKKQGGRQ